MLATRILLNLKEIIWGVLYSVKKFLLNKKNQSKINNLDLERLPKDFKTLKNPIYYIIFVKNRGHGFF